MTNMRYAFVHHIHIFPCTVVLILKFNFPWNVKPLDDTNFHQEFVWYICTPKKKWKCKTGKCTIWRVKRISSHCHRINIFIRWVADSLFRDSNSKCGFLCRGGFERTSGWMMKIDCFKGFPFKVSLSSWGRGFCESESNKNAQKASFLISTATQKWLLEKINCINSLSL